MNNSLKREAMQELLVRIQHNMITRQQFFVEVERLNHAVKRVTFNKIPLR